MAFKSWQAEAKCVRCGLEAPYFKLYEAQRPKYKVTRIGEDGVRSHYFQRLCVNCEVLERREEYDGWDEDRQREFEDYPLLATVRRDLKRMNKGSAWATTGRNMYLAQQQVKLESKAYYEKARKGLTDKNDDDGQYDGVQVNQ